MRSELLTSLLMRIKSLLECDVVSLSEWFPTFRKIVSLFFFGEWPRSRCYGRTAALRLIVQHCDEDEEKDDRFFLFFQVTEHWWNEIDRKETEVCGEKPVPVSICPPQIPHGLALDRTRASAMGDRRLTA
jgi:hypothetical protein